MSKILNRFFPPASNLARSYIETHQRKMLNIMLGGIGFGVAIILVSMLIMDFAFPAPIPYQGREGLYITLVIVLLVVAAISLLERYVSTDVASIVFTILLFVTILISDTPRAFLEGQSLIYLILPVVIASFLLRSWAGYIVAAVIGIGIAIASTILHTSIPSIPAIALIFTVALIIQQSTSALERAIEQERKKNRALIESEDRYRKIIETLPNPTIIMDLQGVIKDCNQAFVKSGGFSSKEEIIGKDANLFIHPDERQRTPEIMTQMLQRGWATGIEIKGWRPDGISFLYELSASILTDWEGNNSSIVCIFQDITERKRMQDELRQSEERFRSLIESSSDIVAILNADGAIRYASPSVERLLGYRTEELVGKNIFGFLHPEDVDIAAAALKPGIPAEAIGPMLVSRIRHKNGTWCMMEVIGHEMYNNPAVMGTVVNCRSITEQKMAENELRRSNQLLENTLASIADAVFVLEAETGRILECNPAASEMFGYPRGEMLTRTPSFLYIDENQRAAFRKQLYQAVSEKGYLHHLEIKMKRKDGTVFPVESSVRPLNGPDGKRFAWVTVVHDITERKQMEDQLRESEEKFSKAFQSNPASMAISTTDGHYVEVNEAFIRTFGYSREEAIGHTVLELNIFVEAERYKQATAIFAETGHIRDFELAVRTRSGEIRYGTFHVEPLQLNNRNFRLSVMTDITERKKAEDKVRESEERYHRLIDLLPIGVGVHHNGKVTMINPTGAKLMGAQSPEEMIGISMLDFVHPDYRELIKRRVIDSLATGSIGSQMEEKFIRMDGTVIDVESIAIPFNLETEPSMLVVFDDITERKRTQEAITLQSQRIQEVSRKLIEVEEQEKRLLAAELHDDLGQSLTSLKLMLELTSTAHSSALRKKELAKVSDLVSEIMAKVRNLSLDLRPAMLDDFGLFAALRWLFERFQSRTGITVHCDYDLNSKRRFSPNVETAAFRITQEALTNIVRHAFVREAQVGITIGEMLSVEITDQGPGFDYAETTAQLMKSMGLSGMQERARLLGGRVEVRSEKGSGTRVLAQIPLGGTAV